MFGVGILDSSKDDFEDGDEIYEAIGEVLHEVADKSENEVRSVKLEFTLTYNRPFVVVDL